MTAVLPPTDSQPADAYEQPTQPTPARHRWPIVLGGLITLLLVAATVIVAYFATRGPSNPVTPPTATAQPTTQPSATPSSSLTPQESTELVANARSFLIEVVGMVDPVAGPATLRGDGTAAVDFRLIGQNGQPVAGAATTVLFGRNGATWTLVRVVCDAIQVDAPSTGQVISTPLIVSGQADVYEGTVVVRVLEPAGGKLVEVGRGVVTGGAFGVLKPFQGQVTFRQPNGGVGWVVFSEDSPVNGQVMRAAVVTVSYPHT